MRRTKEEADELAVTIFKMKMAGKKNKEIADELHIHPSTVSTKLTEMRKQLKDIDDRVKSGDLVLKETREGSENLPALALPTQNPFSQLATFEEMAGITNAGGAVLGAGAASVVRAFKDENAPYEQRMNDAMKGGAVLIGGALSLWCTIQNLTKDLEDLDKKNKEMKNVTPQAQTISTSPAQSTPTQTNEGRYRVVNDKGVNAASGQE